jgi:drug/metabolite transporter (DMT)-like permease
MLALMLGLGAALSWGLHDILVRRISQGPNVLGQILVISLTGAPVLFLLAGADLSGLSGQAVLLAAAAGLAYVMAYVGLFRAFGLAPARLVSPVLGAYPLLSLVLAVLAGVAVPLADWAAVAAVVGGVALVALLAEEEDRTGGSVRPALIWAAVGATGFALTFALGQAASVGDQSLAAGVVTRCTAAAAMLVPLLLARPTLAPVRANWRALLAMGLLDTLALGLVMLAGGFPHAEYAAVAASLFGVVTILLAWALLGERVRVRQWPGIALVFAGISWLAV